MPAKELLWGAKSPAAVCWVARPDTLVRSCRLLKELPIKGCRDVRFSCGGQFFAAVNNAAVQVYNSYTAENIGSLRCDTNETP